MYTNVNKHINQTDCSILVSPDEQESLFHKSVIYMTHMYDSN